MWISVYISLTYPNNVPRRSKVNTLPNFGIIPEDTRQKWQKRWRFPCSQACAAESGFKGWAKWEGKPKNASKTASSSPKSFRDINIWEISLWDVAWHNARQRVWLLPSLSASLQEKACLPCFTVFFDVSLEFRILWQDLEGQDIAWSIAKGSLVHSAICSEWGTLSKSAPSSFQKTSWVLILSGVLQTLCSRINLWLESKTFWILFWAQTLCDVAFTLALRPRKGIQDKNRIWLIVYTWKTIWTIFLNHTLLIIFFNHYGFFPNTATKPKYGYFVHRVGNLLEEVHSRICFWGIMWWFLRQNQIWSQILPYLVPYSKGTHKILVDYQHFVEKMQYAYFNVWPQILPYLNRIWGRTASDKMCRDK